MGPQTRALVVHTAKKVSVPAKPEALPVNQDWDQLWSRWDSIQVHKRPSNNGLKKMVRHQLVAMKGIKLSFMVTLRSVYSDEGISGLYKQGFSEVVYSSLRFGLYKQLIIAFGTNTNGHDSPAWMNVLAGITH